MLVLEKYRIYPIIICFIGLVFSIKIFTVGVIFLFLLILLINLKHYQAFLNFTRNRVALLMLLLFILYSLGLTYSSQLEVGFFTIEKMLSLLILPILFTSLSPFNKHEITAILTAFTLSLFIAVILLYTDFFKEFIIFDPSVSIQSFISFAKGYNREMLSSNKYVTFHHPYLGLLLSSSIIFSIQNFEYIKFKKSLIFILSFLFLFLFQLEAKMSLASLGITLAVFVALKLKERSKRLFYFYTIFAVLFIGALTVNMTDYLEKIIYIDGGSRVRNFESAVSAVKEAPLLGYGTGDALEALQNKRPEGSWEYLQEYNAHNQYLDIILRFGIFGLGYWLFLLGYLMWKSYTEKHYFFTLFLMLFSLCSFTEVLLARFHGIALFALILSIFANISGPHKENDYPKNIS